MALNLQPTEHDVEESMLHNAYTLKGTPNIQQQLQKDAIRKGISIDKVQALVDKVLQRLANTDNLQGKTGNAFGKAHVQQYTAV